jgi:hypothetical protein
MTKTLKNKALTKSLVSGAAVIAMAAAGVAGMQASAEAAFIKQGYSVFGLDDDPSPNDPFTEQCPFCDSTVNFAVYENLDGGDWVSELGLSNPTALLSTPGTVVPVDTTAPYVFFYQVVNTDPLSPIEDTIIDFNVAVEVKEPGQPVQPWSGPNPYSSGGYFNQTVFANATDAITPLDRPADWNAEELAVTPFTSNTNAVNPTSLNYGQITDDEVEELEPQLSPTNGIRFGWDGANPIPVSNAPLTDGTSSLLFLTAHTEAEFNQLLAQANIVPPACSTNPNLDECGWTIVDFPWARTQSTGGDGTSGDVAGLKVKWKKVPEPGSMIGLLAVGSLGLALKRKQRG